MPKPTLDEIAVIRLGVNVPTLTHVLEHDIRKGGGLFFFRGVIDPKHRDDAFPAPAEFGEILLLVSVLDLPIAIDPVGVTDKKINLVVAVIVRQLTRHFLISPFLGHRRNDHRGFRGD